MDYGGIEDESSMVSISRYVYVKINNFLAKLGNITAEVERNTLKLFFYSDDLCILSLCHY